MIDKKIVTKAIIETYRNRLPSCLELDVAVCGGGMLLPVKNAELIIQT